MAQYSQALLDDVRNAVDIVDLVGRFVNLRKAGVNWKGLCPFHSEKTPSFMVNPKKGIFHCFGCGVGGDAFGFLMRQDRVTFPEAVRSLAKTAGIALPEEGTRGDDSGREELVRIVDLAWRFYDDTLWKPAGERARAYLDQRGIDAGVAKGFGLGYAPEGWNALIGAMAKESVREDQLAEAGLALPRQTGGGGFYDRFRGRLLFPIRDVQGRVIAFGGRAMSGEEPKYLNSPETSLYTKGQTLYALDVARAAIRLKQRAIIVEGYLDCLMAHQHGFAETVAALGTAFTPSQHGLIRRHADEVIALFDADSAGQKASARLEEMLGDTMDLTNLGWSVARTGDFERPGHFSIKVALLPQGHDPDSLLRAEGAVALATRLEAARPLLSFVLDRALGEENLATPRGRATAHARIALLLSKVANAEEATTLSRDAARRLGVDATQLWIEAQQLQGVRARGRRPESPASSPRAAALPPPGFAERDLLAFLLHVEDARTELLPVLEDADVTHAGLRALLVALRKASGPPETLMSELDGEGERSLLASLLLDEREWVDTHSHIFELRKRYDIRRRKERVHQVRESIAHAQAAGEPEPAALEIELREVQREAQAIKDLSVARSEPDSGGKAGR